MTDHRQQLQDALAAARSRLVRLQRDRDEIVEIVRTGNVDDEHDPDGATHAWEREQLTALVRAERHAIAELVAALDRLDAGIHGTCEGCGQPIPSARLTVRPQARRCVPCAS